MFTSIIVSIIMMVVSMAIQYFLAKPASYDSPEAGTVEMTTAEEGATTYVLFGSSPIQGNCVWYGDVSSSAIKKKSGGK